MYDVCFCTKKATCLNVDSAGFLCSCVILFVITSIPRSPPVDGLFLIVITNTDPVSMSEKQ